MSGEANGILQASGKIDDTCPVLICRLDSAIRRQVRRFVHINFMEEEFMMLKTPQFASPFAHTTPGFLLAVCSP